MWGRNKCALLFAVLLINTAVFGQDNSSINTSTPYSMYGLGDFVQPGLTAAQGMGGLTTGIRDSHFLDYVNPASASARDSLTFVLDFGGEAKSIYARSTSAHTAFNTANFHHLVVAFPIRKFGVTAGVLPYTNVGYNIEKKLLDYDIINSAGDVRIKYRGEEGLNQVVFNLGYQINTRFAVGLGGRYFFGNINRFYNVVYSNAYYHGTHGEHTISLSDLVPVTGIHYTHPVADRGKWVVGLTYQPKWTINSEQTTLLHNLRGNDIDTAFNVDASTRRVNFSMPAQINAGVSFTTFNKWMLGAELNYQDWSRTNISGETSDELGSSYNLRIGGTYTPNRYDARYYYKRATYRGGLRYGQTPMMFNGQQVSDMAISAGLGLPLQGFGDLNVSFEIGQRGSTTGGLVKETYWRVGVSLTLFELWFRQYKYD